MELILKDKSGADVMILSPESADFEWGNNRNNFELVFPDSRNQPAFRRWGYIYASGTEYGGMLTHIKSEDGLVRWFGPTWTGLLAGKVLVPDAGSDRLTVSGEANAVLAKLISRMGLSDALAASREQSGIRISGYGFDLYTDGYTGILSMLSSVGAKLRIRHDGDRAVLSALPAKDWSQDEEFDSDMVDVLAEVDSWPVNHLVARGEDQKSNRVAVELYIDESGNVSEKPFFIGTREHAEYYNYTSADREKLIADGSKRLREYRSKSQAVSVKLSALRDCFDIGDIVGGADRRTGVSAAARVTSKVLKVDRYGSATISYETE